MDDRQLVFQMEIPIRWGDMDAMGHVNNTVYFRYMEVLRIAWFDAMGFALNPQGEGPVIINAACTFMREFRYPGTVLARQYVGDFGRSSVESLIDMTRTDDATALYARGSAKIVWVDFPKRRSTPMPEDIRERMRTPHL